MDSVGSSNLIRRTNCRIPQPSISSSRARFTAPRRLLARQLFRRRLPNQDQRRPVRNGRLPISRDRAFHRRLRRWHCAITCVIDRLRVSRSRRKTETSPEMARCADPSQFSVASVPFRTSLERRKRLAFCRACISAGFAASLEPDRTIRMLAWQVRSVSGDQNRAKRIELTKNAIRVRAKG
jgi:hypothetical protein